MDRIPEYLAEVERRRAVLWARAARHLAVTSMMTEGYVETTCRQATMNRGTLAPSP